MRGGLKENKRLFNIELNNSDKGIINASLNYAFANINFTEDALQFKDIDKFHDIGLNLNYIRRFNEKWSFFGSFAPQLKSNFTDGIKSSDFYYHVFAIFNYKKNKDRRFTFGLAYMTTLGFPAPIPIIMYWFKLNIDLKISLGFPRINFAYDINK